MLGVKKIRIDRVKLVSEMTRRDMTVIKLSQLAGISRLTASNVKRGASCSAETAAKIAKVFNMPLEALIETEV